MCLSDMGMITQNFWGLIPSHFPSVELDDFVIMPNHLHAIIILNNSPRRGEVTSLLREITLGKVIA